MQERRRCLIEARKDSRPLCVALRYPSTHPAGEALARHPTRKREPVMPSASRVSPQWFGRVISQHVTTHACLRFINLSIRGGLPRMCTAGPQAGLRQLVRSFMRNFDDPSAMFAMDRIRIVSAQAAVGTFNVEPCRAKHQLNQADEEGDPNDHDGDRQESS